MESYHIVEDFDDDRIMSVYVHQDVKVPTNLLDAILHFFGEYLGRNDLRPKSSDDRHPDWCNGK